MKLVEVHQAMCFMQYGDDSNFMVPAYWVTPLVEEIHRLRGKLAETKSANPGGCFRSAAPRVFIAKRDDAKRYWHDL